VPSEPEPVQQAGFGLAEIDIRDADLLKAQFPPPGLDVGGETNEINIMVSCSVHRPYHMRKIDRIYRINRIFEERVIVALF
jgi:hypothetical protein